MMIEIQPKTEYRLARENSRLRQQNAGLKWLIVLLAILIGVLFLHTIGIDLIKNTPDCQNFSSNGCL